MTDGLVALWKFEGNFNDSAGTNHGTPKGGARIVADAARGQVLALDGTGDYVEVPNSPSLNIAGNQISMAAWVNLNSVATVQIIVCKVFSGTTRVSPYFSYSLHALANGQPRVWISRTGGAANQAGAGGMLTAGTWHHVATVYDGTQLKLYFDGALAGAGNVTGNLIGYDTVVRLGANGALTDCWTASSTTCASATAPCRKWRCAIWSATADRGSRIVRSEPVSCRCRLRFL